MRGREVGLTFGPLPTGPNNAITDVSGVRVGHATLVSPGVRSGVTAIVPPGEDLLRTPVRAASFVANGHTKAVGLTQVNELGELETPILLTGTLSTFRVADALLRRVLSMPGNEAVRSVNPVVAETNDARWGDAPGPTVGEVEVDEALRCARGGAVDEGCVGAGTGVVAFGFKAGIGTSSRLVDLGGTEEVIGVLVQANHAGRLVVGGRVIESPPMSTEPAPGSIVVVVATSAAMDSRQLGRLARRAAFALGRTGGTYAGRSGEVAIAFSTEPARSDRRVDDDDLEGAWPAVLDCVDEAVVNSLTSADAVTTSDGIVVPALVL